MQAPTSLVEEEDVVYVYYCECTDVDEDDAMRRCADEILSEEEKQKASKFVRIEDKRMALMSRLMQRQLLSRHSHIPPEQIQIERNKSGTKPIWTYPSNCSSPFIHYNVAHDSSFVCLAASLYLVGIDCMKVAKRGPPSRPIATFFNSMDNQFSQQEWRYIRGQTNEQEMLRRFMRLWTMKEAFIKALGTGLYVEPQRLQCADVEGDFPVLSMDGHVEESFRFHFLEVESSTSTGGHFVVCVCVGLDDTKAIEQYAALIPQRKSIQKKASLSKLGANNVVVQHLQLRSFLQSTVSAHPTEAAIV
eukprot:GHVS01072304.1.p1 GENE.GHVS01072304.1~~GHVS01072304.1.p1  ORF type:complete len:325 (-),score=48.70 GHVS01072304.1:1720-2631(-)